MNQPKRFHASLTIASLAFAVSPFANQARTHAQQVQYGQPVYGRQQPAAATAAPAPAVASTIGTHQIDRFEAIRQLQDATNSDPNSVANWTILGELAHEVALDVPQGQDDTYYKMSREAYERAATLDPNNAGLQSAVQFARDPGSQLRRVRRPTQTGVATYLDARRREMATHGVNPTLVVYGSPSTMNPKANPGQPGGQPAMPPLAEQRRVVAWLRDRLAGASAATAEAAAALAAAEALPAALLRQAFAGRL